MLEITCLATVDGDEGEEDKEAFTDDEEETDDDEDAPIPPSWAPFWRDDNERVTVPGEKVVVTDFFSRRGEEVELR